MYSEFIQKIISKASIVVLIIAFVLLLALQFHNADVYPATRGFDATAHIDYIEFLKENKVLPLPKSGWEMHQPPLYYVIASAFPLPISFNYVGFSTWLLFTVTISFFVKQLLEKVPQDTISKKNKLLLAGSIIAVSISVPVVIYLSSSVGNEFFATTLISITFVYYVSFFQMHLRTGGGKRVPFILGVLLALCLLSKTTSLVVILSIGIERLIATKGNLKITFKQLFTPFFIAALIGGWFYVRNFALYGNLIFQAADYIPLRDYAQPIIDRNAYFFFSLHAFFNKDLFIAQNTSFLAGTYYSWFYDGHGIMVPPQPYTKVGTLLLLMSAPLVALAGTGFFTTVREFFKKKSVSQQPYTLFYVYSFILITSYIQYNFRLPFYSTVKASFISSLLVPFIYFSYTGILYLLLKYKKQQTLIIYTFLLLSCTYVLLITRHFWVDPQWYPH